MLIAELTAPREFRLAQQTIEEPGPGEVQVRVRAVGICGSDLHSYAEGAVGDSPCVYPMVLGHEPAGTVVKAGAGVAGWAAGDRAALEPAIYCYHCEFCRSGRHNVCSHIRFLSTPGHPGFFREFVNLPAANLLGIPPRLSLELATVAEPLAIGLHSMKFASVQIGETVAVFGAGLPGLPAPLGTITTPGPLPPVTFLRRHRHWHRPGHSHADGRRAPLRGAVHQHVAAALNVQRRGRRRERRAVRLDSQRAVARRRPWRRSRYAQLTRRPCPLLDGQSRQQCPGLRRSVELTVRLDRDGRAAAAAADDHFPVRVHPQDRGAGQRPGLRWSCQLR